MSSWTPPDSHWPSARYPDPVDGDAPAAGGGPVRLSTLRGLLLSYAPAVLTPALWAFATAPERLMWTTQLSSRLFSAVSPLYDEVTGLEGYGEALEQALLDLRGVPTRILDMATGTGFAARRLKRQYPKADVVGVDISAEMVAIALHDARAEGLDIEFVVGDAAKLDFEDGSFDLVVSQNAPPYCDEMLRLLRPRGKALLVYSFGGPWVELAWSPIAKRLERAGASHARGKRSGLGFFGIARKRGSEAVLKRPDEKENRAGPRA